MCVFIFMRAQLVLSKPVYLIRHFCKLYTRSLPLILSYRLMYDVRGEQRYAKGKVGGVDV